MRILIINPNSDPKITNVIQRAAESFAGDTFEVVCTSTPGAPAFMDTFTQNPNNPIYKAARPGGMRIQRIIALPRGHACWVQTCSIPVVYELRC